MSHGRISAAITQGTGGAPSPRRLPLAVEIVLVVRVLGRKAWMLLIPKVTLQLGWPLSPGSPAGGCCPSSPSSHCSPRHWLMRRKSHQKSYAWAPQLQCWLRSCGLCTGSPTVTVIYIYDLQRLRDNRLGCQFLDIDILPFGVSLPASASGFTPRCVLSDEATHRHLETVDAPETKSILPKESLPSLVAGLLIDEALYGGLTLNQIFSRLSATHTHTLAYASLSLIERETDTDNIHISLR